MASPQTFALSNHALGSSIASDRIEGGNAAVRWRSNGPVQLGAILDLYAVGATDFGPGPVNSRFTGFSQSAGVVGDPVPLSATQFDAVGTYGIGAVPGPRYSAIGRGSGQSMEGIVLNYAGTGVLTGHGTTRMVGCREFFCSYAFKVPSGKRFPWAAALETFSTGSNWKIAWLLGPHETSEANDICIPSFHNTATAGVGGNGIGRLPGALNGSLGGTPPSWWQWDAWHKIDAWIKAHPTDPVGGDGTGWVAVSGKDGVPVLVIEGTGPIFNSALPTGLIAPYTWEAFNVPGWIRHPASDAGQCQALYTDVAVRWGDNAAARVDMINASSFAASTKSAHFPVLSWDAGRIRVRIEPGDVPLGSPSWLVIRNNLNQIVSTVPLT